MTPILRKKMISGQIQRAAEKILESSIVVAFTGAGVSVESGIPDFRNAESLWEGFDIATFDRVIDNIDAFEINAGRVWEFFQSAIAIIEKAKPNPCHTAMRRMAEFGKLAAVVTQNVDGLHEAAGSENVIEVHGNIRNLHCDRCQTYQNWHEVRNEEITPKCSCGRVLKPDVPLFGEEIDFEAFSAARVLAMYADTLLIVGAHGSVAPVNRIPIIAKDNGAFIIEVNREKSRYTDLITDLFLMGSAAETLPKVVYRLEKALSRNDKQVY